MLPQRTEVARPQYPQTQCPKAKEMIKLPTKWVNLRSTVLAVFGLTLCLMLAGCNSNKPDPAIFNSPPLDAYALSGGKITNFQGISGLPADPAAKALLQACRYLPINSHSARSVYLIFHSRKGTQPIPALEVGDQTLILVGSIDRMLNGEVDTITGSILNLPDGAKNAHIGNKWVLLKVPIIAVDQGTQTVITLPDLLALFRASDNQHGKSHEIEYLATRKEIDIVHYTEQMDQIYKKWQNQQTHTAD